jgi:hypothetical protein
MGEGEFDGQAGAVQLGEKMAESGRRFVTAIGEQEEKWRIGEAAGKVEEKFQRGVVAPVEVFDDNDLTPPPPLSRRQRASSGEGGVKHVSVPPLS